MALLKRGPTNAAKFERALRDVTLEVKALNHVTTANIFTAYRQLHRFLAIVSWELENNGCYSVFDNRQVYCLSMQRRRVCRPAIKHAALTHYCGS